MKLIDKDAFVAEIERRIKEVNSIPKKSYEIGLVDAYKNTLSILNTLEVKEVDLEDSIKETLAQKYIDYTFKRHNIDLESKEGQLIYYAYIHGMNQCLKQLKAILSIDTVLSLGVYL